MLGESRLETPSLQLRWDVETPEGEGARAVLQ